MASRNNHIGISSLHDYGQFFKSLKSCLWIYLYNTYAYKPIVYKYS